jgi:hypothetical protein
MQKLVFQLPFEFRGAAEGVPFEFLPHGFENLVSRPRSEIGGEQCVLQLRQQLGIDFLFTRDQVFDSRSSSDPLSFVFLRSSSLPKIESMRVSRKCPANPLF